MKELLFLNLLAFYSIFANALYTKHHYCSPEERTITACVEIYQPVLGFSSDGSSRFFANGCAACRDKDIESFTPLQVCDPQTRFVTLCNKNIERTCGVNNDMNYGIYSNPCMACMNGKVEFFFVGDCPQLKGTKCSPEDKKRRDCKRIYNPVCGYKQNKMLTTFANACEACVDPEVETYVEGECPF